MIQDVVLPCRSPPPPCVAPALWLLCGAEETEASPCPGPCFPLGDTAKVQPHWVTLPPPGGGMAEVQASQGSY